MLCVQGGGKYLAKTLVWITGNKKNKTMRFDMSDKSDLKHPVEGCSHTLSNALKST